MEGRTSLLRDLWRSSTGDADGGADVCLPVGEVSGGVAVDRVSSRFLKDDSKKPEASYAQVVSSPSSGDDVAGRPSLSKLQRSVRMLQPPGRSKLVGSKRPRSPKEATCGRCFRTSHVTAECRHQVVCLRCSGVGHMAASCKMEMKRSPPRKRLHVRSKWSLTGPPA